MSNKIEIVIGYDAREYFDSNSDFIWEKERIDRYLLKTNLKKPLSVDVMVWDSIFHLSSISLPTWIGWRQQLWDSLERLMLFIQSQPIHQPYRVTAITERVFEDEKSRLEALYGIQLAIKSDSWIFLGFDVADEWLLSGLTNCGYRFDEHEILRNIWQGKLNQYHLFDTYEDADMYREMTNTRVKEHAPFSVYGIYRVT
jgi:hypothetical protein